MARVAIISLGCPRNQVDSEVMAGSMKKNGFTLAGSPENADICVINTCAFIESARKESVDKIIEAAELKKKGKIGYLVICGCLPQLYKEKLSPELPEADLILGTSDFPKLPQILKDMRKSLPRSLVSRRPDYIYDENSPRVTFTPPHYAYLKVSEGCSNFCSYCIISRLRGPFRSRPIKSILKEAGRLSESGKLKELNLIGQDTTLFGFDRYGAIMFSKLLREVCALKNSVEWIRILYTHPAHYTDELILTIASEDKVCKYLDLPIQHISERILKAMNRRVTKKEIIGLIGKLRKNIPGLVIRTSIIAGFPGETEKDFKELLGFLSDTRFERMGAFTYSKEAGTRAARLARQIPEEIKASRLGELMKLQQKISAELNRKKLGKVMDVLIDEKLKGRDDVCLGRTSGDAPEIDGSVYVHGRGIKAGEIYKIKIKDTLEYDLVGVKI
ncbi:MAG: 30S ribosomal protein S12 methylthiotransferase RimO [Candidatus Omnitrophota bacterium]|nr:30S ribosomal protein S12 methylthiotransferase RimO [Candidatus Omnitrophota bacterium]